MATVDASRELCLVSGPLEVRVDCGAVVVDRARAREGGVRSGRAMYVCVRRIARVGVALYILSS